MVRTLKSYKDHINVGLIGLLMVLGICMVFFKDMMKGLTLVDYGIMVMIAVVFSVLPDIDLPHSLIRRLAEAMIYTLLIFDLLLMSDIKSDMLVMFAIGLVVILIMLKRLVHRGIAHSVFASFLALIPLLIIHYLRKPIFLIVALVSYWIHLLADANLRKR